MIGTNVNLNVILNGNSNDFKQGSDNEIGIVGRAQDQACIFVGDLHNGFGGAGRFTWIQLFDRGRSYISI